MGQTILEHCGLLLRLAEGAGTLLFLLLLLRHGLDAARLALRRAQLWKRRWRQVRKRASVGKEHIFTRRAPKKERKKKKEKRAHKRKRRHTI